MKAIVDLCVVPIGVDVGLSAHVARCVKVLADKGLSFTVHANGTNIEGEWDAVFVAIKKCHEVLHSNGVARIFSTIKVGTRTDRDQNMIEKVRSVERHLAVSENE